MNVFIQVSGVVEVSRCGTRSGLDIKPLPLWNMDVSCEHLHIDETCSNKTLSAVVPRRRQADYPVLRSDQNFRCVCACEGGTTDSETR